VSDCYVRRVQAAATRIPLRTTSLATVVASLCLALHAGASEAAERVALPAQPEGVPWPTEHWPKGALPGGLDRAAFDRQVEALFAERGRGGFTNTRALLLVQGGRLVYERYADGFGPESRFQSWSMAKSVTNALAGLVVGQGFLELDAPIRLPAWQAEGDARAAISLRHLLQMRSGLANADGFGSGDLRESFVAQLMFGQGSRAPADFAAEVPLAHPVGEHWAYSTGTSMLVAAVCGRAIGGGAAETRAFLARHLFDPIGMKSALPEFAASGEFAGGAFMHATARDWARFGTLYLRDGVWDGRRILPEGWVDFTRTPAPAKNNRVYGAHFWLNAPPGEASAADSGGQWAVLPGAPHSTFAAEGAYFQMVAVVPSLDLVAVRLGELEGEEFPEVKERFGALIATLAAQGELP
jgi:CubicO group peptidase (beta-lactamase class C family)